MSTEMSIGSAFVRRLGAEQSGWESVVAGWGDGARGGEGTEVSAFGALDCGRIGPFVSLHLGWLGIPGVGVRPAAVLVAVLS